MYDEIMGKTFREDPILTLNLFDEPKKSHLKISYLIPTLLPSKTNKGGFSHNLPF